MTITPQTPSPQLLAIAAECERQLERRPDKQRRNAINAIAREARAELNKRANENRAARG